MGNPIGRVVTGKGEHLCLVERGLVLIKRKLIHVGHREPTPRRGRGCSQIFIFSSEQPFPLPLYRHYHTEHSYILYIYTIRSADSFEYASQLLHEFNGEK